MSLYLDITIFLLHGAGGDPAKLIPLETALNNMGFNKTHRMSYPVAKLPFEECLDALSKQMQEIEDKDNPIILIGQSIGGVFANNLHRKGWSYIRLGIYIASPLQGARFISQLENTAPARVWDYIRSGREMQYAYLQDKQPDCEPPHNFHTISTAIPLLNFDGCVYIDETCINEKNHTHICSYTHWTLFNSPALLDTVASLIENVSIEQM
jgi:hypothetical protein